MLPGQLQQMCEYTPRQQPPTSATRPWSLEPRSWHWTLETHSRSALEDSGLVAPQKTSAGGAHSARSWGSGKHLGCGCGLAAAWRIGRRQQSPRCPSPRHPSPRCPSSWGAPRWLSRQIVNQSSCCSGGDGCCFWGRVRFLSCSFPLFYSIFLRHWSFHV